MNRISVMKNTFLLLTNLMSIFSIERDECLEIHNLSEAPNGGGIVKLQCANGAKTVGSRLNVKQRKKEDVGRSLKMQNVKT